MTTTLRLTHLGGNTMRDMLKVVLSTHVPLGLLTQRAWLQLVGECGNDYERAARFLLKLATRYQKPILLNLERENGESTTVSIPPKGWTEERLLGWLGGYHELLEAEFGEIGRIGRLEL